MENSESKVYIKTIREIAEEIGVSKQAVFKNCLLYTSPSPRDS